MVKFLSNRQRTLDLGISSYTEGSDVLTITGNTSISGIVTAIAGAAVTYYGDGSNLTGVASSAVSISTSAPSSPSVGDLWFDPDYGRSVLYYNDGNTSQWIDHSPVNTTVSDASDLTVTNGLNVTGVSTFNDNLNLLDNDKLIFGTGGDLEIYHDGSHSYIDDAGTGNLYLRSGTLSIQNLAGSKTSAVFNSASGQELYYNNNLKFKTTNHGAIVTGILTATSFVGNITGNVTGNVTGNADTATALQTARTIGGVSFDGTADINLPGVNSTGNQNTSGTAAGLSGSPNITVTDIDGTQSIISGVSTATGGFVGDLTGDVTGNVTGNLTGNVELSQGAVESVTSTKTSTSEDSVDSFAASTYRSVTYDIQITRGSSYHTTTIKVLHDGTDTYMTEYGTMNTGTSLASFSSDISGGNVRLLATPSSATSTVFKIVKTLIKV